MLPRDLRGMADGSIRITPVANGFLVRPSQLCDWQDPMEAYVFSTPDDLAGHIELWACEIATGRATGPVVATEK